MNDTQKQRTTAVRRPQQSGRRLAKSAVESRRTTSRRAETTRQIEDKSPAEEALQTVAVAERTDDPAIRQKLARRQELSEAKTAFSNAAHTVMEKLRRARRRWRHIVREKKARHFPESERAPIQMLLFGWSMLPMAGSRLREVTWGRRKRAIHQFARLRARVERLHIHPAAFLGGATGLAAIALFFSFYTFGTTVLYNGETVASVPSRSTAEEARTDLEKTTTRTLGQKYTIDDSMIQYSSGLLRRQDVVDEDTFEEDLSKEIGLVTSAYCLYVEGERIGATSYSGALEELLAQLKSASTDADTISCTFAENVEIKQEYVPTEQVMNLGYLAEMLYSTKTAEVTYTVKSGDTWSQIANSHGLTSAQLLALNPGYNIDRLQIGEMLTLSASVPYLTMTVVERERYVDDVPFDIVYTDSANLYKGDYKVTSAGSYGAADVVANVTYVNGEETARNILSSVTLREPVTEQRLQGTKERPTWLPTGTFRWPATGRITSRFGGRSSPGGVGSTNHKGIDIAGRRGTPIYAADGGTVAYAGWMGGYGYLVQINHGNGYVTYYGHNSGLTVSVGQHVYKGQQIARMGSTGNSTGNHCHFEVRYNGVAKNPLNYLP